LSGGRACSNSGRSMPSPHLPRLFFSRRSGPLESRLKRQGSDPGLLGHGSNGRGLTPAFWSPYIPSECPLKDETRLG
jgi:hypothetical protein